MRVRQVAASQAVRCSSLMLITLAAAGCSSLRGTQSVRDVSLAEFSQDRAQASDAQPADRSSIDEPAESGATRVQLQAVSEAPSQPSSEPSAGSTRFIVDSMVGQVNGRPIFADEFFAPIEDELRALRRRTQPLEFMAYAEPVVARHLREIVYNELFLAEAEAQLTSEQRMGIFAWMRQERAQAIASRGGTQAGSDRRLRDQTGMDVDEYVATRRDMALIQELRRNKVEPRVIVSWRDVQREYERRYDEFNPPATVTIARIRLSTERDAEQIEQVKQRLADGDAFADIAGDLGQPDGEFWQQFQVGEGGVADVGLADVLKQHLIGLDVGETSQAFEQGSSTWWLHIADFVRPEPRDLSDPAVQRMIKDSLESRRFNEEMNRYLMSLMDRGVADEIDMMLNRLLDIAAVRYGQ